MVEFEHCVRIGFRATLFFSTVLGASKHLVTKMYVFVALLVPQYC